MNRIVPILVLAAWLPSLDAAPPAAQEPKVFARTNLVAWCIVPFDSKHRGPAERAAMVKKLGFTKVAYDWRDNHVSSFEEEIRQYQKHGIEYFAFWGTHDKAFELFAKYDLHPQIWQTLGSPNASAQQERVALAAKQTLPLVERTAKMKCKLGLYNHGGWGGEPEKRPARRQTAGIAAGISAARPRQLKWQPGLHLQREMGTAQGAASASVFRHGDPFLVAPR